MKQFVLAIDQGTTGSTVLVIDFSQKNLPQIIAQHTENFQQYYPKPGWVEHDAEEIWLSVKLATEQALQKVKKKLASFNVSQIAGIGITNQRETLVPLSRKDKKPIRKAIVWQCRRSAEICQKLSKDKKFSRLIKTKTGLVLDPYFSASKIKWLLENDEHCKAAQKENNLVFCNIDAWILLCLTGKKSFFTEPSNASRTMLYNLKKGEWSEELLKKFGVKKDQLPELKNSMDDFGITAGLEFLPDGIPIFSILGDQQAALAGQACYSLGQAKVTYGTGAFLLVNTGSKPLVSSTGLLTTVAWSLNGKLTYALEGSVFIAGAAVQFARDQLKFFKDAADSEAIARDVKAAPEVYFVPALTGLGAPYWNAQARGAFLGLTRGTTQAEMSRAVLEGIGFQVFDLIDCFTKDLGKSIKLLRVDGGAAANNFLMQMQANLCQAKVDRPKNLQSTALGVGYFAAVKAGLLKSLEEVEAARQVDKVFEPKEKLHKEIIGWQKAIKAIQAFSN